MHCRLIVWRSHPLSNRHSSSSAAETTAGTTMVGTVRASTGVATPCGAATVGVADQDGAAGIMALAVLTSEALAGPECGQAVQVDAQAWDVPAVATVVVTEAAIITGNR